MQIPMKYKDKKDRKKIGAYDWQAACRPDESTFSWGSTFSAGVFRWGVVNGKLKRSPVLFRIKGFTSSPGMVYLAAEGYCDDLDAGLPLPNTKVVTVY